MLERIGSYNAKNQLPELLRRVASGESFTITLRGEPVADLIPSGFNDKSTRGAAINNILSAKKHKVRRSCLNKLKNSGRK